MKNNVEIVIVKSFDLVNKIALHMFGGKRFYRIRQRHKIRRHNFISALLRQPLN